MILCFLILGLSPLFAQKQTENVPYRKGAKDEYSSERCKLDIHLPETGTDFQTLVWFHGGGLTGGDKVHIPHGLRNAEICVVSVNYRLSPKAQHPAYIDDAAAAVAWVLNHIEEYGGDASEIYVGGHSAGGYLTFMVGLDASYLKAYDVDPGAVRAYYPVSGQAITHFQIREERGLPSDIPLIDNYAPLAHVRKDAPPFLIVAGQTEKEMACRTVENRFLFEALQAVGNKAAVFHELSGFDHRNVVEPATLLIIEDMKKHKLSK